MKAIAERRDQEAEFIRERSRSKSCSTAGSAEPRGSSESPLSDIEVGKKVGEGSSEYTLNLDRKQCNRG